MKAFTSSGDAIRLAVSCLHCALPYHPGNRSNGKMFVSLPKEVCQLGVKWVGLLDGWIYGVNVGRQDHEDVAIVCLEKFPDGVDVDDVPAWAPFEETLGFRGQRNLSPYSFVVGKSKTAYVTGTQCTYKDPALKESFLFVEEAGEAGNSGTLMYLKRLDLARPIQLGIYLGTHRRSVTEARDLHVRLRIRMNATAQSNVTLEKAEPRYGPGAFRMAVRGELEFGVIVENQGHGHV